MTLQDAACSGADPRLFDAVSGEHVFTALLYCERCAVRPECEDYVKPAKSHFDGVAGGKVWQNGVPVDPALFD